MINIHSLFLTIVYSNTTQLRFFHHTATLNSANKT